MKQKTKSIIMPFIFTVVPVIIAALFVISFTFNRVMSNKIFALNKNYGQTVTFDIENAFEIWIKDQIILCQVLASEEDVIKSIIDPGDPEKYEKARKLFDDTYENHTFYENVIGITYHGETEPLIVNIDGEDIAVPDGSIMFSPAGKHVVGEAYDRNYSTEIRKGLDYYISEAYSSLTSKTPVFVVIVPVRYNGKLVGAVGVAPKLSTFVDKFAVQEYFEENEYIFMVNGKGDIVAHPTAEYVLTDAGKEAHRHLTDRIFSGESVFEGIFNGKSNLYVAGLFDAFEGNSADKWFFVYRESLDAMYADVRATAAGSVLGGIAAVIVVSFIIVVVTKKIILKPLKVIGRELDEISKGGGDLTTDIEIKTMDEIGRIAGSFNLFTETLKQMIKRIKSSVHINSEMRDQLAASVEEASSAVNEILSNIKSIERIIKNLLEQTENAEKSTTEVSTGINTLKRQADDQSSAVVQSTSAVEEMVSSLRSMATITSRNKEVSDQLLSKIEGSTTMLNETSSSIQNVTTNIDSIMEMTGIIDNISSQTNLLAMNAAIEAAHAGDAGKGFAVVADEIRKLAEEAASSSNKITNEVRTIIEQIRISGDNSEKLQEVMNGMISELNGLAHAFSEINSSSAEMSAGSDQVLKAMSLLSAGAVRLNTSADEMNAGTSGVAANIDAVLQLTQTAKAAIEEISIGSNEILTAMTGMQSNVHELGNSTGTLSDEVNRFKT